MESPYHDKLAINNRADILGSVTGCLNRKGFLLRGSRMTILSTLGGDVSTAFAIDESARIVGCAATRDVFTPSKFSNAGPSQILHAALWESGRIRDLHVPGASDSHAVDIDQKGQVAIIGRFRVAEPGLLAPTIAYRSFLWSKGAHRELGPYVDATLNDNGDVLCKASEPRPGWRSYHLFTWGKESEIGAIRRADFRDMNNRRWIIGAARMGDTDQACLWRDATLINLGNLSGRGGSRANALNERGQIVGLSGTRSDHSHAFVYQDGLMVDLNERIAPNSGWVLESAMDINDGGEIVGIGKLRGERRAFLLRPNPAPVLPGTPK